jgi:murein L,D-transpeptidase YcbB/YkuD
MDHPKNIRMLLLLHLFFFITFSCKQKAVTERATVDKTSASTRQGSQLATLDSLWVIDYVRKDPAFKEHEKLVRLFYRERGWKLGWFKNGQLVPQANKFLEVITHAKEEGLNPDDYHVKDYDQLFKNYSNAKEETDRSRLQQEIDVALTASYFNYGSDFYRGLVNPRENDNIRWKVKKNKIKLNKALQTILKERESKYPYYEFQPLHEEYNRLRAALKKYRQMQEDGGWPQIGEVKKLKLGGKSPEVANIRKRLLMEYDPAKAGNISAKSDTVFDESLDQLVKKFQDLNSLKQDGVVGGATLKAMNVPLDDRIDQLIINMERWRWIPKSFEDKYIFVNIPEYTMRVIEKNNEVLTMKVIVGKTMNSTPIFSDKLEYIVFSPFWNVPNSIIENEIKPNMLRNSNFLASQDMEIVKGEGKNLKKIPASSIDWSNVTAENFKLVIRQRPGPKNSLGLVKFLFPNEFNVYLHGTPFGNLFSQEQRGFSHGCVRLEEPRKLADYLLKDQPQWTGSKIDNAMHRKEEEWVILKEKVPVYIVYFTTKVDENGNVYFMPDLYGHDKDLKKEYFG